MKPLAVFTAPHVPTRLHPIPSQDTKTQCTCHVQTLSSKDVISTKKTYILTLHVVSKLAEEAPKQPQSGDALNHRCGHAHNGH